MYTTYILINPEGKTYVGYTEDLERRLTEHNSTQSGKGSWTHGRGPWRILHQEAFIEKQEAVKREKWYKSGIGRRKIQTFNI